MLIDSIAWTGGLNLASNGNFRRWNLDRFVEVKGVQALTMATIHPSHAKISAAIFLGVIGAQTLQLHSKSTTAYVAGRRRAVSKLPSSRRRRRRRTFFVASSSCFFSSSFFFFMNSFSDFTASMSTDDGAPRYCLIKLHHARTSTFHEMLKRCS